MTANEFDGLEEDFPVAPQQTSAPSAKAESQVYNWQDAPDYVKAPPRISMNGQTVTIKKAEIIMPLQSEKWALTRKKDKEVKYCKFILFYDVGGQQEYLSGIRVFKNDDGSYSNPTLTRDRMNQASQILGLYADFKKKDINEISLKEFMHFLNSQPKCKMHEVEVTNPTDGTKVKKNLPQVFI